MHIICPHCTTTYAIDLSTLGTAGRTVRCSRCRMVWLARPEDAVSIQALSPAMADAADPAPKPVPPAASNDSAVSEIEQQHAMPVVVSPPISAEWPAEAEA